MTTRAPRPSYSSKRPLSAIFIGSGSSSSNTYLPDLPDPPIENSPTSSSGLPSPPATNSTGSGSTGAVSSDARSALRALETEQATDMQSVHFTSQSNASRKSRDSSEDGDLDDGGDHTAKLSAEDKKLPLKPRHSDNLSALQRVKSLTQRNRMVLDKLASISSGSRLSSPAPSSTRSPMPPPQTSSSSSSSTRPIVSSMRRGRGESFSGLSGSETEREQVSTNTYSSSDDQGPPSIVTVPLRSESVRQRRISAPDSPDKYRSSQAYPTSRESTLTQASTVHASPRRRPASVQGFANVDPASAALSAVASSRRSPTASRKRQPLPKEFRDRRSLDGAALSDATTSQQIDSIAKTRQRSPSSPTRNSRIHDTPPSPGPRSQRFSTVRDLTRRHQIRWMSQDLPPNDDDTFESLGRAQARRGGSNESALSPGLRSVVGESLRAAGLAKKRDTSDDLFSADQQRTRRNAMLTEEKEPQTPATISQRSVNRHSYTPADPRPSTSVGYHDEPKTAPILRTHKSQYLPDRNRQVTLPPETHPEPVYVRNGNGVAQDRTMVTPSVNGRYSSLATLSRLSDPSAVPEHSRLMLSSLNMFESHLARLPTMGTTTTITIPDLFRSAQNIVHSANNLNSLIRAGTARALEQQIEAEVGEQEGSADLIDVWRTVGSEYRENLRVSDELVRTMTDFLLGVGKLLREATPPAPAHNRTSSLDGDNVRRAGSDFESRSSGTGKSGEGGRASLDGRRNAEARKSVDRLVVNRDGNIRPASRADLSFRPLSSLSTSQNHDLKVETNRTDAVEKRSSRLSLNHRRPLDQRDEASLITSPPPVEEPQDYEPSPTPVSRFQAKDARRSLPPLAVPPPLSTLPSETIFNNNSSASKAVHTRPRLSNSSITTVRGGAVFTPFKPAQMVATVSTTPVSALADRPPRSDSLQRSRSSGNPSSIAVAGLQELEQLDRQRTISTGSASNNTMQYPRTPMSGSETERPLRRTTTLSKAPRVSLDNTTEPRQTIGTASGRRERRMTVTELFSRS